MYICKECALTLMRPAGGTKSGIIDRFAEPKCEMGHGLVHVQSFWGSVIRGFALSFAVILVSRLVPSAMAPTAAKLTVAVAVLLLAPMFFGLIRRGVRYRGKPEPIGRLSEPAFGKAGGLLVGLATGLMAASVGQSLLQRL
jgi:hypothetical protein